MNKTKNITNDLITEYINGFYKPIDQALMNLRLEAEEADVPIILRESEDFFNVFLSAIKPKRILEIGTAVGYSAAYFALQTDAYVITVEKDEIMYQKAKENIERLNLRQQIRIIQGDGEEVILALAADGEDPFDLVFIDAAKSHYQRFLDAALRLCKPGTVIISDNV